MSNLESSNCACEPSRELQESLGPSGPEIQKKSEKSLPGPAKSLEKVSKRSEKSRKSLENAVNACSGHFRDFFQTSWDPGAEGPKKKFV